MKRKFLFSSLMIVIYFLLPCVTLADDPDLIEPTSSEEGPLPTPKDYLSDFPNEFIAVQDLNLTFTYNDVVIPGQNGMDIVVTRKYSQSWYFEMPSITTAKSSTGAVPINFDCLGDIQSIQVNMNSNNLMSVGYSSSSNIPGSTLAALNNNSILVCEGGFPTIIQNDGQKLIFGVVEDKSSGSFIGKRYLLSNKTDRFGNAIDYTYEGDTRTKRLTKITRNDGYIVNLNYITIGLKDVVKSITYKDKAVTYSYDSSARLIQHEDQENRATKYSYTPFLNFLASAETHESLRADYDYYPLDGDALNSGNLRGKTISGPGIKTRQFHHEFPTFFAGKRAIQVEYEVLPGKERTKEFIIEKVPSIPSSYLSGEIILSGKIIAKSVFIGNSGPSLPQAYASEDELLISETSLWGYQVSGTYGCEYRFNSALDSHRSCSIPILRSKKLKINNGGIYDEFITDYSQHNEFGAPKAIVERNSFNAEKRYTSNSFTHDYTNWVVKRTKAEKLSEDNVNWKTSFEVEYYPWSQGAGFRSQIKQFKEFGINKSSYTQYHPNGEIKSVVDANNNLYQFNDYYLGIAKSSLLPGVNQAKTLEVNDDGRVQSITDYLNNKTSFTYDNIGRLLKTEYPLESGAKFWHDADYQYLKVDSIDLAIPGGGIVDGQWKKITSQGTLQKTRFLDALSRVTLLQEVDLSNSSSARYTRFEYDLDGRIIFVSNPSKYADSLDGVRTTYDDLGRIKQIQTNLGTTNVSYLSGNRKKLLTHVDLQQPILISHLTKQLNHER